MNEKVIDWKVMYEMEHDARFELGTYVLSRVREIYAVSGEDAEISRICNEILTRYGSEF